MSVMSYITDPNHTLRCQQWLDLFLHIPRLMFLLTCTTSLLSWYVGVDVYISFVFIVYDHLFDKQCENFESCTDNNKYVWIWMSLDKIFIILKCAVNLQSCEVIPSEDHRCCISTLSNLPFYFCHMQKRNTTIFYWV